MMKVRIFSVPLLLTLVCVAPADDVTFWNDQLLATIRQTATNPPRASRAMATLHVAIYDAVNAIARNHEPYHFPGNASPFASKAAAASMAGFEVMCALYPDREASYVAALNERLALIARGPAKNSGMAAGRAAAHSILALRRHDGADLPAEPYLGGTAIGQWRPTPPAFAAGLLPRWGEVTPFAMTSGSHFRLGGPPLLTDQEYTDNYNEVKFMGRATGSGRTADQTEIARFWADGGGTSTPPGHWFRIAKDVATQRGNTLEENARLFALIGISVADAGIACWDMKYTYEFWRPITAIREGDNDTNPVTVGEAGWTSLIPTPPFPTYTSGHSTFSGGAARSLGNFYGTDAISFQSTSEGALIVTRSFSGFMHAAGEAADSRLFGGIHFRFDNQVGLDCGIELADYVFDNFMRPLH